MEESGWWKNYTQGERLKKQHGVILESEVLVQTQFLTYTDTEIHVSVGWYIYISLALSAEKT